MSGRKRKPPYSTKPVENSVENLCVAVPNLSQNLDFLHFAYSLCI